MKATMKATMQFQEPDNIHVELAPSEQAVVLALGNGEVVLVDDRLVPGYSNLTPVQRAVWVARLRAVADLIEASGE